MWWFRSALKGRDVFSSLVAAGDWVRKVSYHTAWSVPLLSSCSCSHSYGQGPPVGPRTGGRCWPLLAGLWRAIAPLMKPWCAEEVVPSAANLNLYRGWKSRVWHRDTEPLFGECGVSVPGRSSDGRASPIRTVKLARAVLAMVTLLT